MLSSPARRPPDPLADAYALLESENLTTGQLPGLLRQTPSGEQYQPTQLHPALVGGRPELPVALVTRSEPMRGWEALLAANAERIKAHFPDLVNSYLTQALPNAQLGNAQLSTRLEALQTALDREARTLRELREKQHTDYARTCSALQQQQQALGDRNEGWLRRLAQAVFDAAKALQLWNTREAQAFKLESVETALGVLVGMSAQIRDAQANLHRLRELTVAARQTLHAAWAASCQELSGLQRWLPDWVLEHSRLAEALTQHALIESSVLHLLVDPPETLENCLADLQESAGQDAAQLVAKLDLEGGLNLLRDVEHLPPDLDVLLLVGQAVLTEGCLRRRFAWATPSGGRRTLLQLTSDGQPLFGADLEHTALRSASSGNIGQLGFMELIEDITPLDLIMVREALAALTGAQAQQNNVLLEELLPARPALPSDESVEPLLSAANGHVEQDSSIVALPGG